MTNSQQTHSEQEDVPGHVYGLLVLGVASFALSPILVRFADAAPALAIAVWRTGLAVLVLAPFAVRRTVEAVRGFSKREMALIVGAGIFQGLHFVAWIASLYYTTVASASVLVTTSPIFLAVLGYVILSESLDGRTVGAIVIAVSGAGLISWGDVQHTPAAASAPLLGNGLALSASLLVSFYLLIGRVVRQRTAWLEYVFPLYAVAALTALICALGVGVPLTGYPLSFYGLCALMALGPQVLGHGAFNYALQYLPAAIVSMMALLEPVGASFLAYVLFTEVPPVTAILGMMVVLGAIAFVLIRRRS